MMTVRWGCHDENVMGFDGSSGGNERPTTEDDVQRTCHFDDQRFCQRHSEIGITELGGNKEDQKV